MKRNNKQKELKPRGIKPPFRSGAGAHKDSKYIEHQNPRKKKYKKIEIE